MKLRMTLVSMSLLVAVLGLGLFGASASAAPRQKQAPGTGSTTNPHPVRIMGRVDSVSSSGLVLHTQRGNLTVNVNNTTWILVQSNGRCAEGALTDIQTGRPAEVAGMTTATANTINARVIVQGRCMGPVAGKPAVKDLLTHLATGTVKSVNGSTITLTAVNGNREITVNTNVNTVVLANGFQSLSTIKVGDKVDVIGKPELAQGNPPPAAPKNGTRTLDAWAIHVQSA